MDIVGATLRWHAMSFTTCSRRLINKLLIMDTWFFVPRLGLLSLLTEHFQVLGMVWVVKERLELTEAKRNEEHKRAVIKDVFTSRIRRIREWSEQIYPRRRQGNIDICSSPQTQVSMAGKCEPQYSGEPKHYMNMSRNNNQESEF